MKEAGEGERQGRRKEKRGGERPPNPPNVMPVSSSPTSCHLPNALGFIFLIDTSLFYSISIFRLSFSLHHSLPSLAERPHLLVAACPSSFSRVFLVLGIPHPPTQGQIQHPDAARFLSTILELADKTF